MSLAVIPLAITMNAGPQIMSAIIFVTAPKALKLSAYFLAGVVIAVTAGVTITYQRVPVPPHAPADHSQAELAQPREALG